MSSKGGQSLEDKLQAFKYFLSGQGISFVVLKATTSELAGPKKKHLNYLTAITDETNVSIPKLTKCLMERAKHTEWPVSFKALITIHHLMISGNERFIQNLASSTVHNRAFDQLASFVDRSSTLAYDMSTFVRRYSLYVNCKINSYRLLGADYCRLGHSRPNSLFSFASMPVERLMITLPNLQEQIDSLLAFDATPNDLNNGIISSAFSALYKDFVILYIAYKQAICCLIQLFRSVTQPKRAQEILSAYRKFIVCEDKVSDLIRVIDSVGLDRQRDLPADDKKSLWVYWLKEIESHLKQLSPPISNSSSSMLRPEASLAGLQRSPLETISIDYGIVGKRGKGAALASSSSSVSKRSSSASGKPVEVPRLKSPDVPRKQRQRPLPSGRSSAIAEMATNEHREETLTLVQESDKKPPVTTALAAGDNDADQTRAQPKPSESIESPPKDKDLLLLDWDTIDNDEARGLSPRDEEPDLILINDEICSSGPAASGAQQAPPSGWVQV